MICEGLEESLKMRAGVEEKKVAVDPSIRAHLLDQVGQGGGLLVP